MTYGGHTYGGATWGGAGTGPEPITDWSDLNDVRNNLDRDYALAADLDENTAGYDTHASASANGGTGWDPIGGDFTGTFDGQGHTISDLVIDRPSGSNVGLFAKVSGGAVTDLGLENVDITGGGTAGGIADTITTSGGTITRCYVAGTITANGSTFTPAVGGLVGFVSDTIGTTTTISECASFATVTRTVSTSDGIGGLIGLAGSGTSGGSVDITDCYANATVSAPNTNEDIGGLIGNAGSDTISECYASTSISAQVGSEVGGFAGTDGSNVANGYFDTEPDNGIGTKLRTDEMIGATATAELTGFDFASTWETVEASDADASANGYPILQALDRQTQIDLQPKLTRAIEWTPAVGAVGLEEPAAGSADLEEPVAGEANFVEPAAGEADLEEPATGDTDINEDS